MGLKTVFVDNNSDMECLDTISKSLPSELLEKAIDRSKLVQKEITDKNGNRRKVWVKSGEDPKTSKPSKKTEEPKDSKPSVDFSVPSHGDTKKAIIELASKHSKQDIMDSAKQQGVTWKENSHEGINWMRASMAIQKAMKDGTIGKAEQSKADENKPKKATKKADDVKTKHSPQKLRAMKMGSIITSLANNNYVVYQKQDNNESDHGAWTRTIVDPSTGKISKTTGVDTRDLYKVESWRATPKYVLDNLDEIHNASLRASPNVVVADNSTKSEINAETKKTAAVHSKKYNCEFKSISPSEATHKGDIVCLYNKKNDTLIAYQDQGNSNCSVKVIGGSSPNFTVSTLSGITTSEMKRKIKIANGAGSDQMAVVPPKNIKDFISKNVHNVSLRTTPKILGAK